MFDYNWSKCEEINISTLKSPLLDLIKHIIDLVKVKHDWRVFFYTY